MKPEFFAANRRRLREIFGGNAPIILSGNSFMQKSGDTTFPFQQDSNFWYLTGINEPGFVLVLEADKEYVIAPKVDEIMKQFNGETSLENISKISAIRSVLPNEDGWKQLSRRIKKVKHAATLQPSPSFIDHYTMFTSPARARLLSRVKKINSDINFIDLRPTLASMRSIKQPEEIALMRAAIDETASLYKIMEKKRKSARYEYELLAEIQHQLTIRGLEFAYEPIIASGNNALTLHYTENRSKIDPKGGLLVDVAAQVGRYCADITRTVFIEPTKRQRSIYDAVLAVHVYAAALLKPGISLVEYELTVGEFMGEKLRELGLLKTISQESIREYYPHLTSHFLGLDAHDPGDRTKPLEKNMIMTVEPGIYIEDAGIGIRLEDMYLITDSGAENMSAKMPKLIDKLI